MAICNFLFYCVVLFFSSYAKKPLVYGAREVAKHHHIVQMRSLVPASACLPSNKVSYGMPLYDRNGPCSPLGPENSSRNSQEIFRQDQSRVDLINSGNPKWFSVSDSVEDAKLPISKYSLGGGNFDVTVGFGTPKQNFNLTLDTGSELTWIQCKPCVSCHSQEGKIYDPNASTTFSSSSCSASCNYSQRYADHTYSKGYYVQDTLTLSQTDPTDVYPEFIFGCGQDNSKKGFGKAAGILGIGRDNGLNRSFLFQTAKKFSKTFCYCLPATDTMGYLLFGDEALRTCQTNKFTPLLKDSNYYSVNLIGITFGQQRLNMSSYVSSSSSAILDSGTVITRLPPKVYSDLRSAFKKSMSKYTPAEKFEILDTCYNLKGKKRVSIPRMVLHFKNADVNLDKSAVIWRHSDAQVCLAFSGNNSEDELTIIGNHQQRKLNVLYDVQGEKVQFGVGNCGP